MNANARQAAVSIRMDTRLAAARGRKLPLADGLLTAKDCLLCARANVRFRPKADISLKPTLAKRV